MSYVKGKCSVWKREPQYHHQFKSFDPYSLSTIRHDYDRKRRTVHAHATTNRTKAAPVHAHAKSRKAALSTRARTTTRYEPNELPSCLILETGRWVYAIRRESTRRALQHRSKDHDSNAREPRTKVTPSFWLRKPGWGWTINDINDIIDFNFSKLLCQFYLCLVIVSSDARIGSLF